MSQIIKIKRTNVPGNYPSPSQIEVGEIALNMADSLLFFKSPEGEVKQVSVTNVLKLDQTEAYTPTDDYHPSTKAYVDLKVLQSLVGLTTIPKTQIVNNEITLPKPALGDIVHNYAMVYDDLNVPYFVEVTCELSEDKTRVLFDPLDMLDNKYCVLTYLTFSNI